MKKDMTKGFTLVSLLLYVSLASIILGTIVFFLITILDVRVKNDSIIEVDSQGISVMQLMTQTVRNSTSISSPATGATSTTLSVTDSTGTTTSYFLTGDTLQIAVNGAGTTTLTNSNVAVSALTFYNYSRSGTPGTLQIDYTVSRNTSSTLYQYDYSQNFISSATLRRN